MNGIQKWKTVLRHVVHTKTRQFPGSTKGYCLYVRSGKKRPLIITTVHDQIQTGHVHESDGNNNLLQGDHAGRKCINCPKNVLYSFQDALATNLRVHDIGMLRWVLLAANKLTAPHFRASRNIALEI